jgi:4-hydroxy-tetrahydrodipicolinate synthase
MDETVLPPGSYVMGLTPFNRNGDLDEGALRANVQWMARENVGFWPASPATGEGSLMSDAEVFRTWDIAVEEMAGRIPVVAGNREFPTAAQNIRFAHEAKARGMDAIQLYPPTMGHSSIPSVDMFERFYDEFLSAVDMPVILSSNLTTGFEVPAPVFERPVAAYPNVIGLFKHHSDQQNVAEFVARFSSRTTVLTMTQRLMFSFAVGATAELDNLQNIAPRLCRSLHDALHRQDLPAASEIYRNVTRLWAGIVRFSTEFSAPRVVVYKAVLGILGLAGGYARKPYCDLGEHAITALTRIIDDVGLRELEGLTYS